MDWRQARVEVLGANPHDLENASRFPHAHRLYHCRSLFLLVRRSAPLVVLVLGAVAPTHWSPDTDGNHGIALICGGVLSCASASGPSVNSNLVTSGWQKYMAL